MTVGNRRSVGRIAGRGNALDSSHHSGQQMTFLSLKKRQYRRQTEANISSPYLLPPEVWELVFEELTDEGLLAAARACSAFNDRCITIHLSRNGIPTDSLSAGILNIHSPLLSVFQLSRLTPQIHSLICHFSPFRVMRDMKLLRDFIRRSPGLRELRLSFSGDMLKAHIIDTIFPYSQRALLTEFCNVIRAMVAKTSEPIVVIHSGYIFRARTRDLADWGFRYFIHWKHRFGRVARIDEACAVLRPKRTDPVFYLPVWSGGARQQLEYTRHLHSIEVRAIPAASDGTGPFALIVLQPTTTGDLEFGPSFLSREAAIPTSQLMGIIPLVSLPSLRWLTINQDVDPTILLEFLCRHPTIQNLCYDVPAYPSDGSGDEQQQGLLQLKLLTGVPLALPALQDLSCEYTNQTSVLLDSFGRSPQLSSIDIGFKRHSAPQVACLKRALRRLSLHPVAISLHINVMYKPKEHWPIDDEESRIVGCLYGVWRVRIRAREMAEVQPLVPWLGMLPALVRLDISVYPWAEEGSVTASALEEMRTALPWIPHIEVER
ncbi:hypothetical protein FB451DRAFT_1184032 [Mycena latifolia]|nr:hypothetical protein FB451DRAFT_1184032 [Mycena latifolia]